MLQKLMLQSEAPVEKNKKTKKKICCDPYLI